jgi:pSer/pThr/pTyr-binding forkhead associated (FHA) protein
MANVIIETGKDTRKSAPILLGNEAIIGRDKQNVVYINDHHASRQHAKITRESDGFYHLVDMGSRNGTYVNDEKIFRRRLQNKDVIKIGKSIITFNEDFQSQSTVRQSEGAELKPPFSQDLPGAQVLDPDAFLRGSAKPKPAQAYTTAPEEDAGAEKKESFWVRSLFYLAILVFFAAILLWAKWATEKWMGKLEETHQAENKATDTAPE